MSGRLLAGLSRMASLRALSSSASRVPSALLAPHRVSHALRTLGPVRTRFAWGDDAKGPEVRVAQLATESIS